MVFGFLNFSVEGVHQNGLQVPVVRDVVLSDGVELVLLDHGLHGFVLVLVEPIGGGQVEGLLFDLEVVDAGFVRHVVLLTLVRHHCLHPETHAENWNILACVLVVCYHIVEYFEGFKGGLRYLSVLVLDVVERPRDEDAVDLVQHGGEFLVAQVEFDRNDLAPTLLDEFHVVEGHLLVLPVSDGLRILHYIVYFVNHQSDHWFRILCGVSKFSFIKILV